MIRIISTIALLLSFTICFSQSNLEKSILFQPTLQFNSFKFNQAFKKELNSSIMMFFYLNDKDSNGTLVSRYSFAKPVSIFTSVNFKELEFYKKSIHKHLDFFNFQRNMIR